MQKRARVDAALVNIQQLCNLGLQSEIVMPDLMEAVSIWMSAETAQFFWVDSSLAPCSFYSRNSDLQAMGLFLARHDDLKTPEITSYREFLRGHLSIMHGGEENRNYYECTLYNEAMKDLGCECLLSMSVRDETGRPRGSLSLGRTSRKTPFSALQRSQLEALRPHLSLLFARGEQAPEREFDQCDSLGMAIANAEGEIIYCDATARHLLFLAGHPKFRANDGSRDRDERLPERIRGICESLRSIFDGRLSAAPRFSWLTPFGRFSLRARPLEPLDGGTGELIGLDVTRYLPRSVLTWRAVRGHELPPRLQQVCFEYLEGRSLTEIASKLGISRHTVIDHVNRLYERFGLEPSREALQQHLLGPS